MNRIENKLKSFDEKEFKALNKYNQDKEKLEKSKASLDKIREERKNFMKQNLFDIYENSNIEYCSFTELLNMFLEENKQEETHDSNELSTD